jgi:hypothetical protein
MIILRFLPYTTDRNDIKEQLKDIKTQLPSLYNGLCPKVCGEKGLVITQFRSGTASYQDDCEGYDLYHDLRRLYGKRKFVSVRFWRECFSRSKRFIPR